MTAPVCSTPTSVADGIVSRAAADPRPERFGGSRPFTVLWFATWSPADVLARCTAEAVDDTTVLPIRHDGSITLIGPVVGPAGAICVACADAARLRTVDPAEAAGDRVFTGVLAPAFVPLVSAIARQVAADPPALIDTVWLVDSAAGAVSVHRAGPAPDCADCRSGPGRPPEPSMPTDRPVTGPGRWRIPNARTEGERLTDALVDTSVGPVTHMLLTDGLPLPAVSTAIGGRSTEWSYGRGTTVAGARRVALFEALERHLGLWPRPGLPIVRAAFADLGPDQALDPRRLGLPDRPVDPGREAGLMPYDPTVPTRWVQGWSRTRRQPVAVPEAVAYYGVSGTSDAPRFVAESSNGCGLGNSLAEATLYGLLEVAERDAFLMAWYARTPLRRIAVPDDGVTPHLVDRLDRSGYDLLLLDATNDLGVPVVVSLAHHRGTDPVAVHAYFSAGAHPDPAVAIRSAAAEAAVGLEAHVRLALADPARFDHRRALAMLADPELVTTIDDHVHLHMPPEARERYAFLLDPGPALPAAQLWPEPAGPPAETEIDLAAVLDGVVDRLAGLGLETVVVDQTDQWITDRLGLHSVKVIVPGSLPMTFGHADRRTRGLDRLLRVPAELGRLPAQLLHADLLLHPHPFP